MWKLVSLTQTIFRSSPPIISSVYYDRYNLRVYIYSPLYSRVTEPERIHREESAILQSVGLRCPFLFSPFNTRVKFARSVRGDRTNQAPVGGDERAQAQRRVKSSTSFTLQAPGSKLLGPREKRTDRNSEASGLRRGKV